MAEEVPDLAPESEDAWRVDPLHGWDEHLAETPALLHTNPIGRECERWLQEGVIPRKSTPRDIQIYLDAKKFDFPIITQMARDYLAIPATSAPAERVFSMAGNLISKKRGRICSENVRYVLCLRSWGILLESDNEPEILISDDGMRVLPRLV